MQNAVRSIKQFGQRGVRAPQSVLGVVVPSLTQRQPVGSGRGMEVKISMSYFDLLPLHLRTGVLEPYILLSECTGRCWPPAIVPVERIVHACHAGVWQAWYSCPRCKQAGLPLQ